MGQLTVYSVTFATFIGIKLIIYDGRLIVYDGRLIVYKISLND